MAHERDLIGYGGNLPAVHWTHDARPAVQLAVNFEEGAESSIKAGDAAGEQIGEVTTVIKPGQRHEVLSPERIRHRG